MKRRRHWRARLGGGSVPMLRMTALMDIFSTLLLFLLKSFVADGQASTVTPGITLPSSISHSAPREAPVIAVNDRFIVLEGEKMIDSPAAMASEALTVAPLYEALVALRRNAHAEAESSGRIIVQGDREIPFRLLQRVMYTSQVAGYTEVSLAVLQDDGLETAGDGDGAANP